MFSRGHSMLWALLWSGISAAQETTPSVSQDCKAPEYRLLDFAVGSFTMHTAKGQLAGHLGFQKKLEGCAIAGYWAGSQGGQGEVNLYFDRSDGRWHQLYIADDGWVLHFSGQFVGPSLVMTGLNTFADGRRGVQRMTWSMLPDGRLRQFWEISSKDGKSWETLFEALGKRVGTAVPAR